MVDIELIIKIPEDTYKKCKWKNNGVVGLEWWERAIANGTPLPKGHGRLKDIDWIDDNCENHYSDKDGSWCYTWRDIDNAPTIIEADKESKG